MLPMILFAITLPTVALAIAVENTDRLVRRVLATLRAYGPLTAAEILIVLRLPYRARPRVAAALSRLVKTARIVERSGLIYAAVR
jgi:hypothetical protein